MDREALKMAKDAIKLAESMHKRAEEAASFKFVPDVETISGPSTPSDFSNDDWAKSMEESRALDLHGSEYDYFRVYVAECEKDIAQRENQILKRKHRTSKRGFSTYDRVAFGSVDVGRDQPKEWTQDDEDGHRRKLESQALPQQLIKRRLKVLKALRGVEVEEYYLDCIDKYTVDQMQRAGKQEAAIFYLRENDKLKGENQRLKSEVAATTEARKMAEGVLEDLPEIEARLDNVGKQFLDLDNLVSYKNKHIQHLEIEASESKRKEDEAHAKMKHFEACKKKWEDQHRDEKAELHDSLYWYEKELFPLREKVPELEKRKLSLEVKLQESKRDAMTNHRRVLDLEEQVMQAEETLEKMTAKAKRDEEQLRIWRRAMDFEDAEVQRLEAQIDKQHRDFLSREFATSFRAEQEVNLMRDNWLASVEETKKAKENAEELREALKEKEEELDKANKHLDQLCVRERQLSMSTNSSDRSFRGMTNLQDELEAASSSSEDPSESILSPSLQRSSPEPHSPDAGSEELLDLRAQVAELQAKVETLAADVEAQKAKVEAKEAEVQEANAKLAEKTTGLEDALKDRLNQLKDLQAQIGDMTVDAAAQEAKLAEASAAARAEEAQSATKLAELQSGYEDEIARLKKDLEQLETDSATKLADLQGGYGNEIARLKKDLVQLETDSSENNWLAAAGKAMQNLAEKNLEEALSEKKVAQRELEEVRPKIANAEAELAESIEALKTLQEEAGVLKRERDEARSKAEQAAQLETDMDKLKADSAERQKALEDQIDALSREKDEAINDKTERIAQLEANAQNLETDSAAQIRALQDELDTVKREKDDAVDDKSKQIAQLETDSAAQIKALQSELETVNREKDDAVNDKSKQIAQLETDSAAQIKALQSELEAVNREKDDAVDDMSKQIAQLETDSAAQIKALQSELEAVRREKDDAVNDKSKQIGKLEADMQSLQAASAAQVESLQNSIGGLDVSFALRSCQRAEFGLQFKLFGSLGFELVLECLEVVGGSAVAFALFL